MTASDLLAEVRHNWRPPPKRTVTEWADERRRLSAEASAEPGKYRSSRTPYVRDIMDAINDPKVKEVWWMKSAQVGATEILNNICGYFVDQQPAPIIVMQPTMDMGQSWSKDRLAPMVRDTPCLRDKIRTGQSKDGTSTMTHKKFPGGHLTIVGANSAASMASRPIKVVLCDEVDRYPASAGDEGDPVTLVKVRSTTFWDRKFFACSTPTIKDVSRIEKGFNSGDQRYFHVPCQHCGHEQKLVWENLDFSNEGTLDDPVYRCEQCGGLHYEHHKTKMLSAGSWVASRTFHGIASFHISALYSPWKSWGEVAVDFIRAKKGGPEQIKTWKNTMLGECYEESGEVIDSDNLQDRATVNIMDGDRIAVPNNVLVATWGADVQHDRLEVELVGWGAGEESWSIAYEIINGSPDNPLTWQKFDQFLTTDWVTESGRRVDIPIGGIDTGDGNTQQKVYEWVKPRMGKRRGALPFKGASTFTAPVWSSPSKPKKGERDAIIKPYIIGVSQAKLVIYERLRMDEPGAGYMHFPSHYDPHYFKGLTAEKLITKYDKGFPRKEWHKIRERNEPLDCRVYAYAAMKILNPDFDAIQARVGQTAGLIENQSQKQMVRKPRRKMKMRGF